MSLEGETLPDGWVRIELSDWTVAAVQEVTRASGRVCDMRGARPSARPGFWIIEVDPEVAAVMARLHTDPDAALRVVLSGQVGRA